MGDHSEGPVKEFAPLLEELEHATDDHPDISATNDDGIVMSVFGTKDAGYLVAVEDVEEDSIPIQHVDGLSAKDVVHLMEILDQNDVKKILAAADWQPGY